MTRTEVRPDPDALRFARRERILAEMESAGVDILVLGREANARYVSGVPRLWLAGTRPAGPGCVLVRETGAVYILSTWEEGIPEEIPRENLYGYTFNSANFLTVLRGIDGAATARTVATDALSGGTVGILRKSFPEAEIVDGETVLQRARRTKTPEEVAVLRAAVGLAERCLDAAVGALAPGATVGHLHAVFMETMADAGVCTPSVQDVAWVTSRDHPWRRVGDRPIAEGDLLAFDAGVLLDGYAGELGRSAVVGTAPGSDELIARRDALWTRLAAACRPGESMAALLTAYDDAGEPPPPTPVARGLGLGYDQPVVSHHLPATAAAETVEEGMVLALTAHVWEPGLGAAYGQEPVVITAAGPEPLTASRLVDA